MVMVFLFLVFKSWNLSGLDVGGLMNLEAMAQA